MKSIGSMMVALFRPRRGFDGLAEGARWLWLLPFVLLVASAMLKAGVSTPLVMQQRDAFTREQMSEPVEQGSAERSAGSSVKDSGSFETDAFTTDEDATGDGTAALSMVATTSAVVFGGIGAAVSVLFTALFFFIAGKVAARETRFGAYLTLASAAFIPHVLRNIVQTLYMLATGIGLSHPGLGALVAPADPTVAPPLSYALLSQIDVWVLWGLALLAGGLTSKLVGFERPRAWTAFGSFVVVVIVAQAIPTIVSGALMGLAG